MKILLVAPMFPPQRGVAPLRTHSFAMEWARAGHAVTVLTTQKRADQVGLNMPAAGFEVVELAYLGAWPLELLRRSSRPEPEAGARATVGAPDTPSPPLPLRAPAALDPLKKLVTAPLRRLKARTGVFSAVRQPDLTDGWIEPAVKWAKKNGPWDAIVSSGGPPAAHLAALAIRRAGLAPFWVADFRDLWTDNHIYAGLFPFTFAERRRERRVLTTADRLVTVSDGLAHRLRVKSGKPVDVIYNGYDPETFAGLSPEPAFPIDDRVRLVYTGTIYERGQDATAICKAVAAEPSASLVVASDRPDFWQAIAHRYQLGERLDFRGAVPRNEALRMQRDASALILLDWYDPRHGVLTGKVFEYLLSPAPIWVVGGARQSPTAELVIRAGRGRAFGRDDEQIRAAIRSLAAGQPGKIDANQEFIASLTRGEQARRLLRLIERPTMPPIND
ncbi:MAG TPA: glycosyltransferase [Gemmataceae bacterium]|jgi:glycosyltransferase involved in cell wall biosynthesis|nr:glycosyltransferase [Gemmataceae bacterium]